MRGIVFGMLLITVIVAGGRAWRTDPAFPVEMATQVFWLALGTLLVTIVLETVLEADTRRRDREAERFALRTLTASMMVSLGEVVELEDQREGELLGAAVEGQARFAKVAWAVAHDIERARGFDPRVYLAQYLRIEEELRRISWAYIRLLAGTEAEMVQRHRPLSKLADRWIYVDEFTLRASEHANQEASRLEEREEELAEERRAVEEEAAAAEGESSWLEGRRERIDRMDQELRRERARLAGGRTASRPCGRPRSQPAGTQREPWPRRPPT